MLESGPWHVEKQYLVLRKWSIDFSYGQLNLHKLPLWLKLWNIPLSYYHREGISYVASGVGRPLYMDKATARCSRLDYAKVCVEVDASKEIPERIKMRIGADLLLKLGLRSRGYQKDVKNATCLAIVVSLTHVLEQWSVLLYMIFLLRLS